ncbi:hypothetical protein BJ508DRAFT_314476 [Ascobolus immersus RN42]|uniref:Uncharacterized protein n=1 Tax=Ascobolus immersus RN42 TaxID=1160509 RepID=A0A3N4HKV2_ASCIM|nr:hypothetical protein BJ508DRAFT_314476 [Ascobolus immersus RN42]
MFQPHNKTAQNNLFKGDPKINTNRNGYRNRDRSPVNGKEDKPDAKGVVGGTPHAKSDKIKGLLSISPEGSQSLGQYAELDREDEPTKKRKRLDTITSMSNHSESEPFTEGVLAFTSVAARRAAEVEHIHKAFRGGNGRTMDFQHARSTVKNEAVDTILEIAKVAYRDQLKRGENTVEDATERMKRVVHIHQEAQAALLLISTDPSLNVDDEE